MQRAATLQGSVADFPHTSGQQEPSGSQTIHIIDDLSARLTRQRIDVEEQLAHLRTRYDQMHGRSSHEQFVQSFPEVHTVRDRYERLWGLLRQIQNQYTVLFGPTPSHPTQAVSPTSVSTSQSEAKGLQPQASTSSVLQRGLTETADRSVSPRPAKRPRTTTFRPAFLEGKPPRRVSTTLDHGKGTDTTPPSTRTKVSESQGRSTAASKRETDAAVPAVAAPTSSSQQSVAPLKRQTTFRPALLHEKGRRPSMDKQSTELSNSGHPSVAASPNKLLSSASHPHKRKRSTTFRPAFLQDEQSRQHPEVPAECVRPTQSENPPPNKTPSSHLREVEKSIILTSSFEKPAAPVDSLRVAVSSASPSARLRENHNASDAPSDAVLPPVPPPVVRLNPRWELPRRRLLRSSSSNTKRSSSTALPHSSVLCDVTAQFSCPLMSAHEGYTHVHDAEAQEKIRFLTEHNRRLMQERERLVEAGKVSARQLTESQHENARIRLLLAECENRLKLVAE